MSETINKEAHKETHSFQTEVKQLLNLMIHSLYSNKEIFLRELISNAADAADRLRFEALNHDNYFENDSELKIRITTDKEVGTLTISDNGIGMNHDEVMSNLGTIARSGTAEFIQALSKDQKSDSNMIGQFGVGFYSSFIVANEVEVRTRKAGLSSDEGVSWTSKGEGEFSLESINKESRGTEIILHLKDDQKEFLEPWRLRSIIGKYSDHISLPVEMEKVDMGSFGQEKEDNSAILHNMLLPYA